LTKLVFADYNCPMSTQLFEEEAPTGTAPKNGRSPRSSPPPKPEIDLTDPFDDEQEVQEVAVVATEPEPIVVPEPVIAPAPTPIIPTPVPAPVAVSSSPSSSLGPRVLPDERQSLTITLKAGGCEGLVIVGLFEDGAPGEVLLLLRSAPAGATKALEAFAATLTLALPYGIPAGTLAAQLLALVGDQSAHEAASAIALSLRTKFG
jgi:hypothetical protein